MDPFSFLARLVTDAPHLAADFVKLYNDTAHGKGGLGKVATVATDVAGIVAEAAGVAAAQS